MLGGAVLITLGSYGKVLGGCDGAPAKRVLNIEELQKLFLK